MSDRYAAYERLKIDFVEDRILRIVMDTPGKLNAADADMHRELTEIWRTIDADPDVSVAVLRGAGEAFSAGGDLDMIKKITEDFEYRATVWKEARDLVYNIINCSKPVVSAIQGPAVGAGLVCGLLADVSVVGRTARIIDGHTRLGVAAGDHSVICWPLLCGMAKAKYYLLLCETVTGEEAERIGLVTMCVDDDKVHEKSIEIAQRLAACAPYAVRWTKYALNNWFRMAGPAFDASVALEMMGFAGPEVQEGRSALVEKRKPDFDPNCVL